MSKWNCVCGCDLEAWVEQLRVDGTLRCTTACTLPAEVRQDDYDASRFYVACPDCEGFEVRRWPIEG